jgi:steroid delta-isomerase-like uncharacterized protein
MYSQIRRILIACIIFVALGGVFQTATADTEANKAVIDRWLELWKTQDLAIADEVFATDLVPHTPHFPHITDLESYKAEVAETPTTVTDFDATIEDLIAEGDKVVGRFTASGVMQPFGVQYTNTWIIMFRFAVDKIAEEWWEFDLLGVQQQVGVLPPTRETYTWGKPSGVTGEASDPETNKTSAQRMIDEVMNKQNMAVIDELFSTDYIMHDPAWPMEVKGPEGFKQWAGAMLEPFFSDSEIAIGDIITEGDKVVVRWTWSGTHTGEFSGIPPTGRQITVTGISIHRFADGKFVESWASYDGLGMMMQLTTPEWPIAGSWISIVPIPDLGNIIGEWTASPQDLDGTNFTSVMRPAKPEPTVFGSFPDADHQSDHIGQTVKIGLNTYESTMVGYGTKKSELPGMLPEIVYISVIYSKVQLIDENTIAGQGTHAFYLASADVDGDGLPDEGQEPIACLPYMITAKRVGVMPPCVPPPMEPEGE